MEMRLFKGLVSCGQDVAQQLTSIATLPQMLATRMMLPPFPKRIICCPAAWAVNRAPPAFTPITYFRISLFPSPPRKMRTKDRTFWNSSLGLSMAGTLTPEKIPATAAHTSIRPSLSPIISPIFHIASYTPTSVILNHTTLWQIAYAPGLSRPG